MYRKSLRAAKHFGDDIGPLEFEGEYAKFRINASGTELHYRIHIPTELLQIYYSAPNGPLIRVGYESILPYVPRSMEFSMHLDYAEYLYRVIRTNVL